MIDEQNNRGKAYQKLARAKKKGLIKQKPCAVCGNKKSEAHHYDYTKPLEVIWLCSQHHKDITKNTKGISLQCKHCKHKWDYKGKQEFYCTCPRCLYKVKVKQE